jgi:hypothetical protein
LRLNQRQEGEVSGADLLEEPVHLGGVLDVVLVHHAQYVAADPMPAQELIPAHRPLVGGSPVRRDSIAIVHGLRAVEAQPDREVFIG